MRIILVFLLSLVTIAAPASAETRSFGVSGFSRVKVQGPFKVTVATGVPTSVKATGSGAAVANIEARVDGDMLTIAPNASTWSNYSGSKQGPVEITIGTRDLSAVTLNGSGSIAVNKVKAFEFLMTVLGAGSASIADAKVDRLTIGVAGTGDVRVAGMANEINALIKGTSSVDASALTAKIAKLSVDGGGTGAFHVTQSVTANGSGSGLVTLSGNPSCTLKLQGTGSVTGCR